MKPRYKIEDLQDGKKYTLIDKIIYKSPRYGKTVIVEPGTRSDGASGALDIWGEGWWVHDQLCTDGHWFDFSICTNWQASTVLSDILKSNGRWLRFIYWWPMTFLFGGGKCREHFI